MLACERLAGLGSAVRVLCVCCAVHEHAPVCLRVGARARVRAVCDDDGSGEMDLGEFLDMLRKAGQVGLLPAITNGNP